MDIFTRFKQALKLREVHVDNNVFQLHYRVTAPMLLCCAGLVASKQHFGDPIDCITRDDVPNDLMDTYCWIHSTFTLPSACNKTVGIEVAHPCVDKSSSGSSYEERVYHKYYQWVYFVLFFQAVFFYAPHFFWKSCESSLLKTLSEQLREPLFVKEDRLERAKSVVKYLTRRRFQHQQYFYYFTLFEAANLLNVLLQIYVVDQFLGGTFTSYGWEVISYAQLEQVDRVDPMVRVFPRMTKCSFHRFGSSGDVQKYDALCILPLNIINEKIYIFMWFWFVFLALVTSFWLVYRALTFFKPNLRYEVLKRRANFASSYKIRFVLRNTGTGDWFLLSMLCKNMDSQWFRYVISGVAKRLKREAGERGQRNGLTGPNSKFAVLNGRNSTDDAKELILAAPNRKGPRNRHPGDDHDQDDDQDASSAWLSEAERGQTDSNSDSDDGQPAAPLTGVQVGPATNKGGQQDGAVQS